ncbi:hypothetical protein SAMN04487948_105307 [Halogranum amylolyticum]|uniref:Uncharacterized protein n=1 Tax=Halogranum amylolyticum TaxID=660520 RepID=A0A1H8SSV8_9EURY|nr:hypothetical protein [Halogranum amylolyticum]SEO81762.1 hypothetical protein SAMN04487948_105307 [Halogranum amylolyticum]
MTDDNDRQPMKAVSHTNPETGETFGYVYRRGPAVADGGRSDDTAAKSTKMKDIDHTPPHGESANEVWTRGVSAGEDDVDE